MGNANLNKNMRVYHRYLGFFLAGIMAVYAISGILLIFKDTDFLKSDRQIERKLPPDIKTEDLGKALRIREFKIEKEENGVIYFRQGSFQLLFEQKLFRLRLGLQGSARFDRATSSLRLF